MLRTCCVLQAITIYNSDGSFAGVRRPGSGTKLSLDKDGITLTVESMVGSTGLQLKSDPGIPFVYAGFGLLIVSTFLSYLPFAQIWAIAEAGNVAVGGETNRGEGEFEREFGEVMESVPEVTAGP